MILFTVATKLSETLTVPSSITICIFDVPYRLADGVNVIVQSGIAHHLVMSDPEISVGLLLEKTIHVVLAH